MAARAELAVGTVLGGRFRIEGKLGAGTMGTVYEIEHVLTRHRRALKLLDPDLRSHPETWERFQREASIAARIVSPYVVEVFDAGELPEGDAYVLMELLEGESLGALLGRRAPLPVAELASLVREAALGLHAAHEAGIVHRDVKPANLFVCAGGRVKVLDFGICRFEPELTQLEAKTTDPSALGTPAFMAPEQVRGVTDLDRRVDVWALGVLLYVGAAGARPFRASSLPELAVAIDRGRNVPLAEVAPALPPSFVAVVDRAMAVEREDRFPSAAALAEALLPFATGSDDATLDPKRPEDTAITLDPRELSTAEPDPKPPRRSASSLWVVGLVVAIATAAFVLWPRKAVVAPLPAPITSVVATKESPVPSISPSMTSFTSPTPSATTPKPALAKPTASPSGLLLHRDNPYQ